MAIIVKLYSLVGRFCCKTLHAYARVRVRVRVRVGVGVRVRVRLGLALREPSRSCSKPMPSAMQWHTCLNLQWDLINPFY